MCGPGMRGLWVYGICDIFPARGFYESRGVLCGRTGVRVWSSAGCFL